MKRIVAIALLAASPALASVQVNGSVSGAPGDVALTVQRANFRAVYTIVNADLLQTKSVKITVGPTIFDDGVSCDEKPARCQLRWKLWQNGSGPKALPVAAPATNEKESSKPNDITIAPGGRVDLVAEGTLNEIGGYFTAMTVLPVLPSTGAATIYELTIVRSRLTLPATTIVTSAAAPLSSLSTGNRRAPFTIANESSDPLDFNVQLLSVTRALDATQPRAVDADLSVACPEDPVPLEKETGADVQVVNKSADKAGTESMSVVALHLPGKTSRGCFVTLNSFLTPGLYRANVELYGGQLENLRATVEFGVRLPWWVALVILLAGSACGVWLSGWQSSGRQRAVHLAKILDLGQRLRKLEQELSSSPSKNGDAESLLRLIDGQLHHLEKTVRDGASDQEQAIVGSASRIELTEQFALLERAYDGLNGPAPTTLATARAAVIEYLRRSETDKTRAYVLLDAYRDELIGAAQQRPVSIITAAADSIPAVGLPILLPTFRSSADAWRYIHRIDTKIAVLSIVLTAVVGLGGLWWPDEQWGSVPDLIVALLGSIAAGLSGTLSLQQITSGYSLPKVGA